MLSQLFHHTSLMPGVFWSRYHGLGRYQWDHSCSSSSSSGSESPKILISHLTRIKSLLLRIPRGPSLTDPSGYRSVTACKSQGFWCVLRRDLPWLKPKVSISLPWLKHIKTQGFHDFTVDFPRNLPSILSASSAISIATHRDSPSSAPRVLPFEEPLRDDISGWWFGTWLLFSPIVGMMIQSFSNSIIFQGGGLTIG